MIYGVQSLKKVLLLVGGNSTEHLVSCMSAKCILENIDKEKYSMTTCCIDYNNDWYIFNGSIEDIINWKKQKIIKIDNIVNFLKTFDIVFPIIHGNTGEDGKLQGMLDLFNIKYVGCKTTSSAIGMDKEFAKMIFAFFKIPQVPFITINEEFEKIKLDFPLIVKPANGGSSIGITKASNLEELKTAISIARKYDKKVIVEKFIKARELEVAVFADSKMIVSEVGEIIPANEFYDYNAKYENDKSYSIIPADIKVSVSEKIKEYSEKAFKILGARGMARIDFLYDEINNKIYLNEINTIPGFTTISMYPKLLIHMGISYKKLLSMLIE